MIVIINYKGKYMNMSFLNFLHNKEGFINEGWIEDALVKADSFPEIERAIKRYVISPRVGMLDLKKVINVAIKKYPNKNRVVLYRGLNFIEKRDYDNFMKSVADGVYESTTISSWTDQEKSAIAFARMPVGDFQFFTQKQKDAIADSDGDMVGYGVVLQTTINPNVGLDVNSTGMNRESEVVLPAGKYKITFEIQKSLHDSISDIQDKEFALKQALMKFDSESKKLAYSLINKMKPSDIGEDVKELIYNKIVEPTKTTKFGIEFDDVYHDDFDIKIPRFAGKSFKIVYNNELNSIINYEGYIPDRDFESVVEDNRQEIVNLWGDLDDFDLAEMHGNAIHSINIEGFLHVVMTLYPDVFRRGSKFLKEYLVDNYKITNSKEAANYINKKRGKERDDSIERFINDVKRSAGLFDGVGPEFTGLFKRNKK